MEINKPKPFNLLTAEQWLDNIVNSLKVKLNHKSDRIHVITYRNDDGIIILGYNATLGTLLYDRLIGSYLEENYQLTTWVINELVESSFNKRYPDKMVVDVDIFNV